MLILGRVDILPSLSQVPVIPLSTQARSLRWEVILLTHDGLPNDCVLKPEWTRIVERRHIGPLIATLDVGRWREGARGAARCTRLRAIAHLMSPPAPPSRCPAALLTSPNVIGPRKQDIAHRGCTSNVFGVACTFLAKNQLGPTGG